MIGQSSVRRPLRDLGVMASAAIMATIVLISSTVGIADADLQTAFDGPVTDARSLDEVTSAFDYTSADADTLRLYRAFLNRDPDVAGGKYWIAEARNGAHADDLAFGFARSREFTTRYGTLSNREFLELLYENMLARRPDREGFDYWLQKMESAELGQHGVVRWIVANDEFFVRYPYGPTHLQCGTAELTRYMLGMSPELLESMGLTEESTFYHLPQFDLSVADCLAWAGYDPATECEASAGDDEVDGARLHGHTTHNRWFFSLPGGQTIENRLYVGAPFDCRGTPMRVTWFTTLAPPWDWPEPLDR